MLTGARPLLRATLKQNRTFIAPWAMIIMVLSASSILAYRWVFPDLADRQGLAAAMGSNPALEIVFGPARDMLTNDGFNAWRAGQLGCLFAALLGIMLIVRNTRADEDSGNAEFIASGVISRPARLLVPVQLSVIAALVVGVVTFLGTWASGGQLNPSALIAATFAGSVLVWGGVAAIAAQLGADSRTASSLAMGLMGVMYVFRGYVDSADLPSWALWLTPFGWAGKTGVAMENNWWPLLAFVVADVVLVLIALALQSRRDFGQGLLPQRPAQPSAPNMVVFMLAWRTHRGAVSTWLLAFALLGTIFGNLATTVGETFAANPAIAASMAAGATTEEELIFGFIRTILSLVGIIAAIAGAQIILRVYSEEIDYRIEPLLAGSLRRSRMLASHVAVAFGLSACGLLIAGTAMGVVASSNSEAIAFTDVLRQAAAIIPAVWLLGSIAVAAVGARPAARLASWAVIVATFAITLLGPTFKFPDWAMSISPLYHVPTVIGQDSATPLVWLGLIAAAFLAIGFAGYHRRDIV